MRDRPWRKAGPVLETAVPEIYLGVFRDRAPIGIEQAGQRLAMIFDKQDPVTACVQKAGLQQRIYPRTRQTEKFQARSALVRAVLAGIDEDQFECFAVCLSQKLIGEQALRNPVGGRDDNRYQHRRALFPYSVVRPCRRQLGMPCSTMKCRSQTNSGPPFIKTTPVGQTHVALRTSYPCWRRSTTANMLLSVARNLLRSSHDVGR